MDDMGMPASERKDEGPTARQLGSGYALAGHGPVAFPRAFTPRGAPVPAAPALPRPARTPEGAFGGAGGFGGALPPPMLPPVAQPEALQEPMQAGMFEGSVTFLSAVVDPNGSQAAAEAVAQGRVTGDNIVRGIFATPRSPMRKA